MLSQTNATDSRGLTTQSGANVPTPPTTSTDTLAVTTTISASQPTWMLPSVTVTFPTSGPVNARKPDGSTAQITMEEIRAEANAYNATHKAPEGGVFSFGMNNQGQIVPMEVCYQPPRGCVPINDQAGSGNAPHTIPNRPTPMLGFGAMDATAPAVGVLVTSVATGTPAEKIGLQAGDIIVAVDTTNIASMNDIVQALEVRHIVGDNVTITWTTSAGVTHSASATLIAVPSN